MTSIYLLLRFCVACFCAQSELYPNGFFVAVLVLSNDEECAGLYQNIRVGRSKVVDVSTVCCC